MASVRRTIYAALVTQLGTISVANGYNTDLASAQKVLYSQDDGARPYLVVTFPRESKRPSTQETYSNDLRFEIHCYIKRLNRGAAESVEDEVDDLVSDIERLLMLENEKSPPLSVTGIRDIELGGHEKAPLDVEAPQAAMVFGNIAYQHQTTDPSSP